MRKISNDELNRLSVDDFKTTKKFPIAVVLDNVRSMHNVGAAFRTADAFAVEKLQLCGITGTPPHREIHKTALGSTETVKWSYFPTTVEAILSLKKEGFKILVVEQTDQKTMLQDFSPVAEEKYAFIFGHEVFGVSDEAVALADGAIEIPQFGTKHSLNITVSLGVVIWDVVSKLLTLQQHP
jgi:23S rRNA (guanosine2251-2'-O)-methyltransferase